MLTQLLNQLAHDSSFQNFSQQILNKTIEAVNFDTSALGEIEIKQGQGFGLKSSEISAKWQQCAILAKQMSEEQRKKEFANPDSQISILRAEALSLMGKLNSIKGQFLENYLQAMSAIFKTETKAVGQQAAINTIADFVKQQIPNMKITSDITLTQGQQTSSIDVIIGDEYIKTVTSKGKVDVVMNSPFMDGQKWYVSAKNYAHLRDIDLLGNGSLIGLISQAFGPGKESKYVYNAFTIPDSNWTSVNMHQLKQIFAIQALTGQKNEEIKSNVLVLSINTNKNPIRVISTYALLEKVFNDTNMAQNGFKFRPELESVLPIGSGGARMNRPDLILNQMSVSIALNRSALTAKYVTSLG